MRSSSTLPVPHPGSAPPTPTRLTGPNSDTEEEERGDLIQFYNNVYIEQIKEFALKYTSNAVSYILCLSFVNTSFFTIRAVFLANLPLSKFKGLYLFFDNFTSRTYPAAEIPSTVDAYLLFPPVQNTQR